MINIIKTIKIVANSASYKRILKISTAKSAIHLLIILKIASINIYQRPQKRINLEKISPTLISLKKYLKKSESDK